MTKICLKAQIKVLIYFHEKIRTSFHSLIFHIDLLVVLDHAKHGIALDAAGTKNALDLLETALRDAYPKTEIDARKQSEEKLRRSEADLLEEQRLSHAGSWRHDLASGTFTVSPEVLRIR